MQQPFSVGLSPSIGFDFRSGVQSCLKMLLTKPSLHWRSIEKPVVSQLENVSKGKLRYRRGALPSKCVRKEVQHE
jgi:hypothetical protein